MAVLTLSKSLWGMRAEGVRAVVMAVSFSQEMLSLRLASRSKNLLQPFRHFNFGEIARWVQIVFARFIDNSYHLTLAGLVISVLNHRLCGAVGLHEWNCQRR